MTTVVLVHGAWHGAWCWDLVTPLLRDGGVAPVAVELPFTSFADDVAVVRAAVAEAGEPVVLVGHSYGGSVVSAASAAPGVAAVLYVTAKVVGTGEPQDLTGGALPEGHESVLTPELVAAIRFAEDRTTVSADDAKALFYHDCPAGLAETGANRLRPVHLPCATGTPDDTNWSALPTSYVLCTEDRAIPYAVQAAYASRLDGETVTLSSGHSPFYSHPAELSDHILRMARSVGAPSAGARDAEAT
ncbi:alpha/beta hydrolase [Streptomyces sp. DT171]|uniref:alpha/beta hydrolase n=1 Tax=Streptomyces sp. DT171 TaxID=3416524 RepID=UPI003CE686A7